MKGLMTDKQEASVKEAEAHPITMDQITDLKEPVQIETTERLQILL